MNKRLFEADLLLARPRPSGPGRLGLVCYCIHLMFDPNKVDLFWLFEGLGLCRFYTVEAKNEAVKEYPICRELQALQKLLADKLKSHGQMLTKITYILI